MTTPYDEAVKALEVADLSLSEIPPPRVNDGARVNWAVSDDVPESIAVARSWIAAALATIREA